MQVEVGTIPTFSIITQQITSSNIDRIGYHEGSIYISFKSGGIYRYDKAPFDIYLSLLSAESAGKFFHANIRNKYVTTKLSFDPFDEVAKATPHLIKIKEIGSQRA